MSHLLEFEDLSVTYRTGGGEVPAVRGVNLTVDAGQIVGVAGESGCGKSTLASTILRLQPANARVTGRVLFEGEDVQTMRWGDLRALRWAGASIVFQGALHSLNPVHRVGHQIAEPIRLHEPRLAAPAGRRRGSASCWSRWACPRRGPAAYPHQLSGGQRQRVMIAMALACRPRLIVADEPTTALDVMVQAQVLGVLADLVDELGVGMMMISHDLSVLADAVRPDRGDVRRPGRRAGPGGPGLHRPAAPLRQRPVGVVPADRRPGGPVRAGRPAGRPARPGRAAPRLLVPPPVPAGDRRAATRCEPPLARRRRPDRVGAPASGWGAP